jgi:hypothetical protein
MAIPGIVPGARLAKEEVNYRIREQCLNCDHFYPSGNCDLVAGNISPNNVCDKFEIKSQPGYKDKEFFVDEYNKANK